MFDFISSFHPCINIFRFSKIPLNSVNSLPVLLGVEYWFSLDVLGCDKNMDNYFKRWGSMC